LFPLSPPKKHKNSPGNPGEYVTVLSVGDGLLGVVVEDVDLSGIEANLDLVAHLALAGAGLDNSGELVVAVGEVQVGLCAEELGEFDGNINGTIGELSDESLIDMDVVGTDTEDNLLACVCKNFRLAALVLRQSDLAAFAEGEVGNAALVYQSSLAGVHLRSTDEGSNEEVCGILEEVLGSCDLLYEAVLHNNDTSTHGHSLGLVVGNVDEGGSQLDVQLGELGTHSGTELSIQVGEGLVEQEDLGVTNDSTTKGNTLSLTTGQSCGLSVEQVLNLEDLSSLFYAALDLILSHLAELKTERHVLENGHVGIQSIVLENHGDISLFGGNIVNELTVDIELTFGDLFQTGDHSEGGGLTAAGRTNENDKFLIFDIEIEIGNSSYAAGILLIDALESYTRHI